MTGRHAAATRWLLTTLVVAAAAPAAFAAGPSSRSHDLGALQVIASCSPLPGGSVEFDLSVANRGDTSAGSVRLDVDFNKGTKLHYLPGFHDAATIFPIAGRHAWNSAQSLAPYTGLALQVAAHGVRSTTSYRIAYAMTENGVRHSFPVRVCSAG